MKTKRKSIGKILVWSSLVLLLMASLFFLIAKSETFLYRNIQRSVLKMDKEMEQLMKSDTDLDAFERSKTGLTVFQNDSLVFWNHNEVNPKLLKRRISVGRDTICHLLSGHYFVKSYEKGQLTYYLFQQINPTYPIENLYFNNHTRGLPLFIDAKISFKPENSIALKNNKGEVLTHCQIAEKPTLRKPFSYLWPIPFVLLLLIGLSLLKQPKQAPLENKKYLKILMLGIIGIALLAALATYLYHLFDTKNVNEKMRQQALLLKEKRDTRFEASYAQFAEQIKADTNLREMLFAESNVLAEVVFGYTQELLFDETMKAYTASLTLCSPDEEITIYPEGYDTNCDQYFKEKLANNVQERVGEELYFIDYYTLDPNYLGILHFSSPDSTMHKTLYFEFYKPVAPEGFGFPKMLQQNAKSKSNDFSVGRYQNNILVYKYGRYSYPNFLSSLKTTDQQFSIGEKYKHYALNDGKGNGLVISTQCKDWSEIAAPFALFFLGLLTPFVVIMWRIRPGRGLKKSFKQRLQTVVFSTLAIAVIPMGPVSIMYMKHLYNQKTKSSQFENTRTIALEMGSDVDFNALISRNAHDAMTEVLHRYATTFFTELNLYGLDGGLIATTRQEIFDLNLQAPLMNAKAYQTMHGNKELFYTQEEHLGKAQYESAYIPLTDGVGNTLAYLNTPYFSSAAELHKEIQNFVLNYINIILLVLAFALIIVIRITNKLTQPLSLIQSKLGDIKIDQKNEPIEWKGNDEIGKLVGQYNKLIVELEKSAAELKRTTTESAWRGVARQVAHEIKNSLTPMRLSVQMLQRNIDNGKATSEQIQRTTNTLIEQIDALSDIASSFSSYAKMPENHPQPFNLAELIQNVVNLYDNTENIVFQLDFDNTQNFTFNGDKTNLNSAISNLVKNATQAIGTKPDGRIEVALKSNENQFFISVKDNGKGIKDEDKGRIFLPNFTTKSGGSGVGLSLTYNIVQAAGGTITFESEEGKGAAFVITLPQK